jgi:glycosyltransferase
MKISIITATYNSARTVRDTLQSIAEQSYPYIEHIIIDGLSKDDTLLHVKQFSHVTNLVCEKDKGIYDAMNKGIALASGEIVGILNSDDVYINNSVIGKVMERFEDDSVDIVYGDLQYVNQMDLNKVVRTWKAGSFTKNSFYYGWMPLTLPSLCGKEYTIAWVHSIWN